MSLIDKLKSALAARQQNAVQSYQELLDAIVQDASFPEKRALEILESFGKTPDEFAADVELERKRSGWRADIEAGIAAQKELTAINIEHGQMQERWKAERKDLQDRQDAEYEAHEARRVAQQRIADAGAHAENQLAFVGTDAWRQAQAAAEKERRILSGEEPQKPGSLLAVH